MNVTFKFPSGTDWFTNWAGSIKRFADPTNEPRLVSVIGGDWLIRTTARFCPKSTLGSPNRIALAASTPFTVIETVV